MYTGEPVTLRCEIQGGNVDWDYEWTTTSSLRPPDQNEHRIESARSHHSGNYRCRGRRKGAQPQTTEWSGQVSLTVSGIAPRPVLAVSPSWPTLGAPVTLSCRLAHPSAGWSFHWYEAVPDVVSEASRSYRVRPLAPAAGGAARDTHVVPAHTLTAGYACRAGRGSPPYFTDHSEASFVWSSDFHPAASLTAIPDVAQILVSGSVSLKCEGESEWRLSRLSGGTRLSHYRCGGADAGSACTISSQWPQDAVYWCDFASGRFSNAVNITVQDTDVLLVSPAHPVTAGAPVSLSCRPRKQEGAPSNVFFYHDDKLVQNASGGRLSLSAVSTSDQGFYRCEHSGKMSPQSWMSVKAQRRAVELESENLLFTVLSIAGPVGGILLLILCPLVVFCYRRAKGPGRDWTYENRPQVYSSLLHGDLCVYETIGGSEMAGGGTVQNLIALKLILLLQPGI
ncbi:uncharacterized protein ACNS7B_020963 isoform 2-T3 [Menidia menidia]